MFMLQRKVGAMTIPRDVKKSPLPTERFREEMTI
jgi:hypothetical protein